MGTTSDKLTYLNTTKGKIKDVINMTGANITSDTTFRNYATKLYDGYIDVLKDKNTLLDNMPKGTSTGATTDAADLPVYEDKMSKESSQDGTPTPDNPVEVKTVKGYRNLFDGVVYKANYIVNSTGTEGYDSTYNLYKMTLDTNKTYNISGINKNVNNKSCRIGAYNINDELINIISYFTIYSNQKNNASFTIPENTSYIKFHLGKDCENIQIVEGEQELPYVPYGTNWIYTAVSNGTDTNYYTIPLNDNEIAGIGDYKDELIVDKNGKCWLNKKTGKAIFDGSNDENWTKESLTVGNNFYIGVNNSLKGQQYKIFNNIGKYTGLLSANYNTYISNGGNLNYVCVEMASVGDFKTMLSNQNMIIYYILATENLIDLNYTVDLTLFEGVNNISNSEDMDMEIKYIKDTYE